MKALSVKQPWAWLIVNGYKTVENRDWNTKFRGRHLIHASKGMTGKYYDEVKSLLEEIDSTIVLPDFIELECGGIVGSVDLTKVVTDSDDPFFFGTYGFIYENARPMKFTPCAGSLGFWNFEGPIA
jgi:hypothetical protein